MANEGVFDCFIRLCLKIWRISKFGETQTHSLCQKALCIASAMCFNVANLDCFLFKSKKIIKILVLISLNKIASILLARILVELSGCKVTINRTILQENRPCPYFLQVTVNQLVTSVKNVPFDYFAQIPLN